MERRSDRGTEGKEESIVSLSPCFSVSPSLRPSVSPSLRLSVSVAALFNAADRLTLAYLIFSTTLIVVCRRNVPQWATLVSVHLGLIVMIFGLAYARKRSVPVLGLLSHWYPPLIFLFFFEEIGLIVHAIFPGWFDECLIRADYAVFGVHPTVWLEGFSNYWLNEYMQLAYTSYFLLTMGLGAYLWIRGRREDFAVFIASTCAAY